MTDKKLVKKIAHQLESLMETHSVNENSLSHEITNNEALLSKELSQKEHTQQAKLKVHSQGTIKHAATNRGK